MEIDEIDEYQDMVRTLVREKDRLYYDLAMQMKNELVQMRIVLEDIRRNTSVRISPS